MSAVEILRDARALIADKSRWTQEVLARNTRGDSVSASSGDAVCWCAMGAFGKVARDAEVDAEIAAYEALRGACFDMFFADVPSVNDGDTSLGGCDPHEAVLSIFDEAIVRAGSPNA